MLFHLCTLQSNRDSTSINNLPLKNRKNKDILSNIPLRLSLDGENLELVPYTVKLHYLQYSDSLTYMLSVLFTYAHVNS
jgi:hypothetical protein